MRADFKEYEESEISPLVGQQGGGSKQPKQGSGYPRPFSLVESEELPAPGGNVEFDGPRPGYYWFVDRVVLQGSGSCDVHLSEVADGTLIDYASSAVKNVADNASPYFVPGGQKLIFAYEGLAATTRCTVRISGRVYEE